MSVEAFRANNFKIYDAIAGISGDMPAYIRLFFESCIRRYSLRTAHIYAKTTRSLFDFLLQKKEDLTSYEDITSDVLSSLTEEDFLSFLYQKDISGKQDKYSTSYKHVAKSAIVALYNHLADLGCSDNRCMHGIDLDQVQPSATQPLITKDEVSRILSICRSGDSLSLMQKKYHEKSWQRDAAILSLLLKSGLSVSDCVSLDIGDIDFLHRRVRIARDTRSFTLVSVSDDVASALHDYMDVRMRIHDAQDEFALFLSRSNTRMTDRAIQMMVQKYAPGILQGRKRNIPVVIGSQ